MTYQPDRRSIREWLVDYIVIYPLCVVLGVAMLLLEDEAEDEELFPIMEEEDRR